MRKIVFFTYALLSLYVTPFLEDPEYCWHSRYAFENISVIFMVLYSFLSLALVARQNNYARPVLTADSMLDIKNGRLEPFNVQVMLTIQAKPAKRVLRLVVSFFCRHVLQEMAVDTFIPNDTKIFDDGKLMVHYMPAINFNLEACICFF